MLYNENRKKDYLNEKYPLDDKNYRVLHFLDCLSEAEKNCGKDIVEFEDTELDKFVYSLDCKTHQALTSKLAILRDYIYWEVKEGYCKSKNIVIDLPRYKGKECDRFINKIAEKYRYLKDKDELHKLVDQIKNYRDKAVLCLLYEGVCGADFKEIRYLKIRDCDFESKQLNIQGDNARIIKCDSYMMEILYSSSKETEYLKNNGNDNRTNGISKLIDTGYIIKISNMSRTNENTVSKIVIPKIFENMRKEIWDINYNTQYLTPYSLKDSGLFHKIYELEKTYNSLSNCSQLDDLFKQYGISKSITYQYWMKYQSFKRGVKL